MMCIQKKCAAWSSLPRSKAKSLQKGKLSAMDGSLFMQYKHNAAIALFLLSNESNNDSNDAPDVDWKFDGTNSHFTLVPGFGVQMWELRPMPESISAIHPWIRIYFCIDHCDHCPKKSKSYIPIQSVVRLQDFVFKVVGLQYVCRLHRFYFDSLVGMGCTGSVSQHIFGVAR